jgi:peptidoglycan/LPS O-acetylase OafA/YrhL
MRGGHTPNQSPEFRKDITGLRAIAVVAVVLYHFKTVGFTGGFVGVDIFFVISGYLMTRIILMESEAKSFSLIRFYLSRARRIIPALAALCLALMVIGYAALSPVDYKELSQEICAALGFFSNFLFWGEAGYFDSASREKLLLHTWSLSIEWQFYMLYPVYIQVAASALRQRSGVTAAIWAAFVLSIACSIFGTQFRPLAAFYLLPTRAWEMLAGGLVFLYAENWRQRSSRERRGVELVGLALICLAIASYSDRTDWPGYLALVPVAGTALVLLAEVPQSMLTGNAVAQFLGQWSYSIYLWHWPIVVYLRGTEIPFPAGMLAAGIALSVLIGFMSFHFIEQPFRKMLQRKDVRGQIAVYAGGALPVILFAVGVYTLDGITGRYNGHNLALLLQYQAALDDWGYPSNCGRTDFFGRLRLCRIGRGEKDAVLFVGDSQVEQWWPRFNQMGDGNLAHPIIFATYGGCPPLPRVNRITPGFRCAEFFEAAKQLASRDTVSTVVFGSVWTDYFVGAYNGTDEQPALYILDENGKRVTVSLGSTVFKDEILEFTDVIAQLVRLGKRVIVILPIPGRHENISKELYVAAWKNTKIPDLSIPEKAFQQYSQQVVSALRAAASTAGAEIIDPLDFFCKNGRCPVVAEDGKPLYRDGAHLRPFAVKERAIFLDDIVR